MLAKNSTGARVSERANGKHLLKASATIPAQITDG